MSTLAGNVVLWLIAGLVIGWVIAWLGRGRMMDKSIALLQTESHAKYEQLSDLDGRVTRLENDLLNANALIQVRDTAVAQRDQLLRQQTEQLADRSGQIAHLTVESADRHTRLSKQEASYAVLEQEHRAARARIGEQTKRIADDLAKLAVLEPVPAKLTQTQAKLTHTLKSLESAQARVNVQDQEISRLHKRTVELEPLTIAVKAREGKLVELQARLAEAFRIREAEIAQLKKRLAETLRTIETNDETLRSRVAQIETLEGDRSSQQRRIDELQRDIDHDQRSKESETNRLRAQIAELEPLIDAVAAHSARALELERGIKQREHQLRHETREISQLRTELLGWLRLAGALPSREAEIARLRAQCQALKSKLNWGSIA